MLNNQGFQPGKHYIFTSSQAVNNKIQNAWFAHDVYDDIYLFNTYLDYLEQSDIDPITIMQFCELIIDLDLSIYNQQERYWRVAFSILKNKSLTILLLESPDLFNKIDDCF